jgi:predicted TIM-barrel fold metal-dependent hydrolase
MTQHTAPRAIIPDGATDCHMHVFGDLDRYPPAPVRSYTPAPASLAEYEAMTSTIGLSRNVFVTASAYGADNSCMLDAMRERGAKCRGIAVIDDATTDAELAEMNSLGVRGVRVNAATFGVTDPAAIGAELDRTIARVAKFGWHVQIFAQLTMLDSLHDTLAKAPVPIVIDHMGLPRADRGLDQPGFSSVLKLLSLGHIWVKIGGTYRVSTSETDFSDATPFAHALVAANPTRCVWGTDWPHTGAHKQSFQAGPPTIEYRPLDDGRLLDLLADATDAATFRRVLVDNPAELYGF